jgi:secreted trypsin-like serine protease
LNNGFVFSLNDPSEMTIRLGEYDFKTPSLSEKDFKVKTMKMHEQYNRSTQANDIALLTMAKPVTFSESIKHICLPDKNIDLEGKNSYVIGTTNT